MTLTYQEEKKVVERLTFLQNYDNNIFEYYISKICKFFDTDLKYVHLQNDEYDLILKNHNFLAFKKKLKIFKDFKIVEDEIIQIQSEQLVDVVQIPSSIFKYIKAKYYVEKGR